MPSSTVLTGRSGTVGIIDVVCHLFPCVTHQPCAAASPAMSSWSGTANLSYRIRTVWGAGREDDKHRLAVAGHHDHSPLHAFDVETDFGSWKKGQFCLEVLVTRSAFWILWLVSSFFSKSFLLFLLLQFDWNKTKQNKTPRKAAMLSKTLTLLRLVSYGIIIIIIVNTENFPSIWWVLPPLIPVSVSWR